jgi:hypothetical protein
MDGDGRGQKAAVPVDDAAALRDVAECLRHLACGYGLDPRERAACLRLLKAGIPDADSADLAAATKLLQAALRGLTGRQRDQASELSIRFAGLTEVPRESERECS